MKFFVGLVRYETDHPRALFDERLEIGANRLPLIKSLVLQLRSVGVSLPEDVRLWYLQVIGQFEDLESLKLVTTPQNDNYTSICVLKNNVVSRGNNPNCVQSSPHTDVR
jgi:hypothetical protein